MAAPATPVVNDAAKKLASWLVKAAAVAAFVASWIASAQHDLPTAVAVANSAVSGVVFIARQAWDELRARI